jgi:hypothetical protein
MPGRLDASLSAARATGLATSIEEMTLGAVSVAAPITDAAGTVRAAVGLVTHSTKKPARYAALLTAAALEISRLLGQPPQPSPLGLGALASVRGAQRPDPATSPLPAFAAAQTRCR